MSDESTVEFDIQLVGARDLIAELRALKEDVAIRTSKSAVKKVGDLILNRLRANAPVFTGKLRFNLISRTSYVRERGVVKAVVGARTVGKASNARNAFYWRFVEFGHKTRPRDVKKYGIRKARRLDARRVTEVPGQSFVRNTLAQVQQAASTLFFREIERALSRAARRAANRRT